MTRIASLLAATSLLFVASPALAGDASRTVEVEVQSVAKALDDTAESRRSIQQQLNDTWARARTARAAQQELRHGSSATSEAGQARLEVLDAEVAVAKIQIQRLQGVKRYLQDQGRKLQEQKRVLTAMLLRLQRGPEAAVASR